MNRYKVTRQNVNCGPMLELNVVTIEEARHAYDLAVADDIQFAEIFDMQEDMQVIWYLAPSNHTVY